MSDCFLIGSGEKEEFPPLYQHTFQKMVTVGQSHHIRQIWADGIMGFMHPKIFQRLQLDLKPYRSPRIHRVDFRHHPLLFLAGSSFKFPSHPMNTTDKLSYFLLEDSPVNQFHSPHLAAKMDAAEEARSSVFIDGTSAAKQRLQQLLHLAGQSYFLAAQCPGLDLQDFTMFHHVSPCFTMFHHVSQE